jgi:hypothetical protein
MQIHS